MPRSARICKAASVSSPSMVWMLLMSVARALSREANSSETRSAREGSMERITESTEARTSASRVASSLSRSESALLNMSADVWKENLGITHLFPSAKDRFLPVSVALAAVTISLVKGSTVALTSSTVVNTVDVAGTRVVLQVVSLNSLLPTNDHSLL